MVLMGINPRVQQVSSQNGSPRSLLFQMWNIWKQPPWNEKITITNVVFIAITVIVHGYLTGNLATRSGNTSMAILSCSILWFWNQYSNLLLLPHGHQWVVMYIIYVISVSLNLSWEGEFLELEPKKNIQTV